MYFNSKFLLLSLVLPSVLVLSSSSPIATTSAGSSDDTVLAHIQSIPEVLLSNSHREKLMHFRDAFVEWKKQHFRVYDFVEMEVKKMMTWVENHGTSVCCSFLAAGSGNGFSLRVVSYQSNGAKMDMMRTLY